MKTWNKKQKQKSHLDNRRYDGYGGYQDSWVPRRCRHNPTTVDEVEGVELAGASYDNVPYAMPGWVALSCYSGSATSDGDLFKSLPVEYQDLKTTLMEPLTQIRLNWPDQGTPSGAGVEFWCKLHSLLKKHEQNLLVYCYGGHGRTGTALAAYLIVNGGYSSAGAVARVRTKLCKECVESEAQIAYLTWLDQEMDAEVAK